MFLSITPNTPPLTDVDVSSLCLEATVAKSSPAANSSSTAFILAASSSVGSAVGLFLSVNLIKM